jgi:hypothetical protein
MQCVTSWNDHILMRVLNLMMYVPVYTQCNDATYQVATCPTSTSLVSLASLHANFFEATSSQPGCCSCACTYIPQLKALCTHIVREPAWSPLSSFTSLSECPSSENSILQDAKREWAAAGRQWQKQRRSNDSQRAPPTPVTKPHVVRAQSHDSIEEDVNDEDGAQACFEPTDKKSSHEVAFESPRDSISCVCATENLSSSIGPNQYACPAEACRELSFLPAHANTQNSPVMIEQPKGEKRADPRSRTITFDERIADIPSNESKEKRHGAQSTGTKDNDNQNVGKNAARRCFGIPIFTTPQLLWKKGKLLEAECMLWLRIRPRNDKRGSKPVPPETSQMPPNASQPTERDEEREHSVALLFFNFVRMKGGSVCLGDVEEFYGSAPRDARACVYRAGTECLYKIFFCTSDTCLETQIFTEIHILIFGRSLAHVFGIMFNIRSELHVYMYIHYMEATSQKCMLTWSVHCMEAAVHMSRCLEILLHTSCVIFTRPRLA